jgi:hypothetical protein
VALGGQHAVLLQIFAGGTAARHHFVPPSMTKLSQHLLKDAARPFLMFIGHIPLRGMGN